MDSDSERHTQCPYCKATVPPLTCPECGSEQPSGEDGFGIVEAVVAMGITFLVMTSLLAAIVASEKSLSRSINYHLAANQSESAVSLLTAEWGSAEYDTAVVEPTRALYVTDGTCSEWSLSQGKLLHRTWVPGDPAPTATMIVEDVSSLSLSQSEDTLLLSLAVKRSTSAPTVNTERATVSSYVRPEPVEVLDPFGNPVPPVEPSNPCVS